jgi:hypothetical protein
MNLFNFKYLLLSILVDSLPSEGALPCGDFLAAPSASAGILFSAASCWTDFGQHINPAVSASLPS